MVLPGVIGGRSSTQVGVDKLLDLLAQQGHLGTFFTVGWLAERQPSLVRRIADAGHEIASHTWWHRRVDRVTRDEFRQDVGRTRALRICPTSGMLLGPASPIV